MQRLGMEREWSISGAEVAHVALRTTELDLVMHLTACTAKTLFRSLHSAVYILLDARCTLPAAPIAKICLGLFGAADRTFNVLKSRGGQSAFELCNILGSERTQRPFKRVCPAPSHHCHSRADRGSSQGSTKRHRNWNRNTKDTSRPP